MPVEEGGGAPGSVVIKQAPKDAPPPPPGQSPPSGGGSSPGSPAGSPGGGGAAATYPSRPSGFGAVWTGWTGNEADSFFRFLPGAAYALATTRVTSSVVGDISYSSQVYNDGVVIPDSSFASFKIPPSLQGHALQVGTETGMSVTSVLKIYLHKTLMDGSTNVQLLRQMSPTAGLTRLGALHTFLVGEGSSAIDFFSIQAGTSGAVPDLTTAALIVTQVR